VKKIEEYENIEKSEMPSKIKPMLAKLTHDYFSDPIRYLTHRRENGLEYHKEACEKGWEGVIAKKSDSNYIHSRSTDWLKFKCVNQQEFVIGGFTDPEGERIGFGALLIGYYKNDELRYAGRVGTGYDYDFLESFSKKLEEIERDDPPFSDFSKDKESIHWVEPKYVGEVSFTEWAALVQGVLGVLALIFPAPTVFIAAAFLGVLILVDGVISTISGLTNIGSSRFWWLVVIYGILATIFGITLFVIPELTIITLISIFAIWMFFSGLNQIVKGIILQKEIGKELLLLVTGALSIVFSIVLVFVPFEGLVAFAWMLGIYFVLKGIVNIAQALRLRDLKSSTKV
jgi:uncharacterized membrane protein HdeD (DUF308 family)